MKLKIVFINKTLISGGIEKCIELLSKYIYKDYEIEIVYTDDSILDPNIVNILKKYANIYKIEENTKIECDICIWCFLYLDFHKLIKQINSKKHITWIHSMPRILPNCLLDDKSYLEANNSIICVSKAVQNNLHISKDSTIIYNFVDESIKKLANEHNPFNMDNEEILKLSVISRLSTGKGFERLYLLCQTLKRNNIPFHLIIAGKGRKKEQEIREMFKDMKEVEFVGLQKNPYPYMKHSDYLVQLSDDESWCNSITEAKSLSVPVIVTNFESSKEQIINNESGIVIDLQETNYDKYIKDIINNKKILKDNLKNFKHKNDIDKWLKQFTIK